MKKLTIVIPAYNSEAYIARCLDSLLIGLDDKLDVIVVNDGSTDNTSKIAHEYSNKHPFIRVIDKENGGHGSAFNVAIKEAKGLYFKILDSDDTLDSDGLKNLIFFIEKHSLEKKLPDIYFADYYSVSDSDRNSRVLNSVKKRVKKLNIVAPYSNMKKINPPHYLMLHMVYIKTSMLRDNDVSLLEHCFYEDNQLLFTALNYSNTFCYLDKAIYLYTVGRADQSISVEKMAKNYQHQHRVITACYSMFSYEQIKSYDRYKRRVILSFFYILAFLSLFYSHLDASKEKKRDYRMLLKCFKMKDIAFYKKVYHRSPITLFGMMPRHIKILFLKTSYSLFSKNLGWS